MDSSGQLIDLRKRQEEFARTFSLSLRDYLKLAETLSLEELFTALELLKTSQHKSVFRKSKAYKIREWLADGNSVGKPLSPAEFRCCVPKWPIRYQLPSMITAQISSNLL